MPDLYCIIYVEELGTSKTLCGIWLCERKNGRKPLSGSGDVNSHVGGTYLAETSFSCIPYVLAHPRTWIFVCFPNTAALSTAKLDLFVHLSRTLSVFPDTALLTFAESAESTNVTRQSYYNPAEHSLGSANFRWIWVGETDSGNAFRPQTFFGVIETTINFTDALKCSNETLNSPKGFVDGRTRRNNHKY